MRSIIKEILTDLTKLLILVIAITSFAAGFGTQALSQQVSNNRVEAAGDWAVFVEKQRGGLCWAVTAVSSSGREAQLIVTFNKGKQVAEVSFTPGLAMARGGQVLVQIDGRRFSLSSDGWWAWPSSKAQDALLIQAIKAGKRATLTSRSTGGVTVIDEFSLRGSTATINGAARRCGLAAEDPPRARPAPPAAVEKKPTPSAIQNDEIIPASSGTGFSVSRDGYVVTNNHVIEGCQEVWIHYKGKELPVTVVTYDPKNDLALLKGDFRPSVVFPLSINRPELLQDIYVAGYPFGDLISTSVKVTKGIISSLTGIGNNFSNIQIDAALQSGNSGGPILDELGNVVGVAVSKLDAKYMFDNFGTIPENTNFGIKSNVVRSLLDSNEVDVPPANQAEISKSQLSEMISSGTYYISCRMTMAQIEEMRAKKVFFSRLD